MLRAGTFSVHRKVTCSLSLADIILVESEGSFGRFVSVILVMDYVFGQDQFQWILYMFIFGCLLGRSGYTYILVHFGKCIL